MDKLNRTDWEKIGRYIAQKGGGVAYTEKYGSEVLIEILEITRSRCRARKCHGGCYFDPVTFDTAVAPGVALPDPKSSEKDEAEGVDEVLSCHSLCITANSSSRSID
jgi:hypothetical protein